MKLPVTYKWQTPCRDLFLEADSSKLLFRFYRAVSAIEERLLSPVEPGSHEETALQGAQRAVELLRPQMAVTGPTTQKSPRPHVSESLQFSARGAR